ncbi:hypothetical protein DFH06DRAFT_1395781 [Mycena polygramma]|nr:hypothetical protein DFH06DRAFT_1395781 [Mycena polygramma]
MQIDESARRLLAGSLAPWPKTASRTRESKVYCTVRGFYKPSPGTPAASFLEYWLVPSLTDPRVNDEETLILLTFDETETYTIQNKVFTLALGGAVPLKLSDTTGDTLYTHCSSLSTVQANWGLKSLDRQDTNASVKKTGYKNVQVPANQTPAFNLTGVAPGALSVLIRPGLNTKLTQSSLPPPDNIAARNGTSPWQMSPRTTSG